MAHDHVECGKHTAGEVVTRLRTLFEEQALLQAMYDVGYFPQNTPLPKDLARFNQRTGRRSDLWPNTAPDTLVTADSGTAETREAAMDALKAQWIARRGWEHPWIMR